MGFRMEAAMKWKIGALFVLASLIALGKIGRAHV
jgi:hypothetical protein